MDATWRRQRYCGRVSCKWGPKLKWPLQLDELQVEPLDGSQKAILSKSLPAFAELAHLQSHRDWCLASHWPGVRVTFKAVSISHQKVMRRRRRRKRRRKRSRKSNPETSGVANPHPPTTSTHTHLLQSISRAATPPRLRPMWRCLACSCNPPIHLRPRTHARTCDLRAACRDALGVLCSKSSRHRALPGHRPGRKVRLGQVSVS